jgi:hypothetical protein
LTKDIPFLVPEVARTRLREEGTKYRSFWQTLATVAQEEGYRGVYRGLGTQLIRQIPNTAIMMATYEAVVYALTQYCGSPATEFYTAEEASASSMTSHSDMIINRPVEEHELTQ